MKKEKVYYLDLLAVREYVDDLVRYCEDQAKILLSKIEEDEKKNEQLQYSYQEYNYYKMYSTGFKLYAYDENVHSVEYKSSAAFKDALNNKELSSLRHIDIELNLSFRSGKNGEMVDHVHNITIRLEPNASYLKCEYSEADDIYHGIRKAISDKLENFPAVKTIFSKEAA